MLDEVEEQRSGREEEAGVDLQPPFREVGGSPPGCGRRFGLYRCGRRFGLYRSTPDPSRWHQTASLKWHPACEGSAGLAGCEARWVSTGTAARGQQGGACVLACICRNLHNIYM